MMGLTKIVQGFVGLATIAAAITTLSQPIKLTFGDTGKNTGIPPTQDTDKYNNVTVTLRANNVLIETNFRVKDKASKNFNEAVTYKNFWDAKAEDAKDASDWQYYMPALGADETKYFNAPHCYKNNYLGPDTDKHDRASDMFHAMYGLNAAANSFAFLVGVVLFLGCCIPMLDYVGSSWWFGIWLGIVAIYIVLSSYALWFRMRTVNCIYSEFSRSYTPPDMSTVRQNARLMGFNVLLSGVIFIWSIMRGFKWERNTTLFQEGFGTSMGML